MKRLMPKALALVVFFVVLLCGCSKGTPSNQSQFLQTDTAHSTPAKETTAPTGEITIYLEASFADELVRHPILQAIEEFEQQYPDITVYLESPVGGLNNYEAREADILRLNTEIMAGGGPDVFLFGGRHTDCNLFPDLQKAMRNGAFLNCMEPLLSYGINCSGEDFWQSVMQAGQVDGAQYIVPLSFDIAVALADEVTLEQSGFRQKNALQNTTEFMNECAAAYERNPAMNSYLFTDLVSYIALEPLDYDMQTVCLGEPTMRQMLELNRFACNDAQWNQGSADFAAEMQSEGISEYYSNEAARLRGGTRLLNVGNFSHSLELAWVMTAQESQTTFLPVPNETGGVTATVGSYAAIRASTQNADAAAAFVAFLLGDYSQTIGAGPSDMWELPVRKSSLAKALDSQLAFKQNAWWLSPTEQEKETYLANVGEPIQELTQAEKDAYVEGLGQPLDEKCEADLVAICEKIDVAHLQSIWSNSVRIGQTQAGDDLIRNTYQAYMNHEITIDDLISALEPRLFLYINE